MKFIHGFLFLLGWIGSAVGKKELTCTFAATAGFATNWIDTNTDCVTELLKQVRMEVDASLTYLAMGAHFARDDVNRPGFSDLFFKSASEEREHAIKFLEYVSMRGNEHTNNENLLDLPLSPNNISSLTGIEALNKALEKEVSVTASIKKITQFCEASPDNNKLGDYHLVDYLSGVFLEEQYIGQRDLAGKISTLGKMMGTYKSFGEFLFDKKLLHGEL